MIGYCKNSERLGLSLGVAGSLILCSLVFVLRLKRQKIIPYTRESLRPVYTVDFCRAIQ